MRYVLLISLLGLLGVPSAFANQGSPSATFAQHGIITRLRRANAYTKLDAVAFNAFIAKAMGYLGGHYQEVLYDKTDASRYGDRIGQRAVVVFTAGNASCPMDDWVKNQRQFGRVLVAKVHLTMKFSSPLVAGFCGHAWLLINNTYRGNPDDTSQITRSGVLVHAQLVAYPSLKGQEVYSLNTKALAKYNVSSDGVGLSIAMSRIALATSRLNPFTHAGDPVPQQVAYGTTNALGASILAGDQTWPATNYIDFGWDPNIYPFFWPAAMTPVAAAIVDARYYLPMRQIPITGTNNYGERFALSLETNTAPNPTGGGSGTGCLPNCGSTSSPIMVGGPCSSNCVIASGNDPLDIGYGGATLLQWRLTMPQRAEQGERCYLNGAPVDIFPLPSGGYHISKLIGPLYATKTFYLFCGGSAGDGRVGNVADIETVTVTQ
jgi:hypothetical protein